MEETHLWKIPVVDRWVCRSQRKKNVGIRCCVRVFFLFLKTKQRKLELSKYSLQSSPPLRLPDQLSVSTYFSLHANIHKCTVALPFENYIYSYFFLSSRNARLSKYWRYYLKYIEDNIVVNANNSNCDLAFRSGTMHSNVQWNPDTFFK